MEVENRIEIHVPFTTNLKVTRFLILCPKSEYPRCIDGRFGCIGSSNTFAIGEFGSENCLSIKIGFGYWWKEEMALVSNTSKHAQMYSLLTNHYNYLSQMCFQPLPLRSVATMEGLDCWNVIYQDGVEVSKNASDPACIDL